ncbi:MAG: YiaA/YiaB family inner membrane protein [Xanthobacteraceae bacterium]
MNENLQQHTPAWVTFTYVSFFGALGMVGVGIVFLPVDWWVKGFLGMGVAMLVQSCITMTKTIRDVHEASRLVNRLDEARTERILMGVKEKAA